MKSVTFNQNNLGYSMKSVLSPKKIGAPKWNRWLTISECHSWDCQQRATANNSITGTIAAAFATVSNTTHVAPKSSYIFCAIYNLRQSTLHLTLVASCCVLSLLLSMSRPALVAFGSVLPHLLSTLRQNPLLTMVSAPGFSLGRSFCTIYAAPESKSKNATIRYKTSNVLVIDLSEQHARCLSYMMKGSQYLVGLTSYTSSNVLASPTWSSILPMLTKLGPYLAR
jgi:hypothetical protein